MESYLSDEDLRQWALAMRVAPEDPEQLLNWIGGPLKNFFPFGSFYCVYAKHTIGRIRIVKSISIGHERQFLEQIETTFDIDQRGALARWFKTRKPFFIDQNRKNEHATEVEIEEIKRFGLKNVVAHGIIGIESNSGTYFSFSGFEGEISDWHLNCVKLICPFLHELFVMYIVRGDLNYIKIDVLTKNQKKIVRLLMDGLDDKSIAQEIGISEKTVRNQLSQVYSKIGVHKRTQLVNFLT